MSEPLFDDPVVEYRLFDAMRLRFVPGMRGNYTEREVFARNEYFEKSKCKHLQWRQEEEMPVKVRSYTVKR